MDMNGLVNRFIPEHIAADPDTMRRTRYLVMFMLLSPFFYIPNILKWLNLGSGILAASMCVVMAITLFSLFIIRLAGSAQAAANITFTALFLHFILLPCLTGGIDSTALAWNMVVPVFAATFVGIRTAVFWTVVMLAEIFILCRLKIQGYPLPVLALTPEQLLHTQIANIVGPLLALIITLAFVEKGIRNAFDLQRKTLKDQEKAVGDAEKARAETEQMMRHMNRIFEKIRERSQHLTDVTLNEMSDINRRSARHAEQSGNFMGESGQVIARADAIMAELAASMTDIAASSKQTADIIKNIHAIAFRTNLLALNAAVEAARAGESGASFSVVAAEVKNLANQTAGAAENTEQLIRDTLQKIDSGTALTRTTGKAFSELADNIKKVVEFLADIGTVSAQQTHRIADIGDAVKEMNEILDTGYDKKH